MTTVASRDLRNHTAAVLKQVAEGAEVTVTVHGEPVALITRPRHRRRAGLPKAELLALLDRQEPDPTLSDDIAWISEGSTGELGPVR
ncbi:MAG: type II toxin-antitoxin system prevent-host-death family antitoxin [Intrasporangium sp.]|uniref:type II toxin-antitoxin system Phd/YefM family antitoxin n=1 Tax=Intrasporangium sp. TaxID=1925024 RepID=UPI002649ACFC|nr:type II toxin-antitoxin system prevent-host-death family antitoxin [Intrasporangium sp.]MDN5798176.1 type II toxin-antitoxin system prevent-host-death family antitoxin [Intrasporangium sp.]